MRPQHLHACPRAVLMAAISHHLLHHLIRPPPPPSSFLSLFLKPTFSLLSQTSYNPSLSPLSIRTHFLCTSSSSSSLSLPHIPLPSPLSLTSNHESVVLGQQQIEDEESELENLEELKLEGNLKEGPKPVFANLPSLSVKEKKELASYAHSLGEKLKCQLVGKSGVTASVASAFVENLESNELLKIKIHRTCPGELADVVKQLVEATGSVVVGQIGRAVILYRPSLTKLKAEEKKRQNRRVYVRKASPSIPRLPNMQKKGLESRVSMSGRGRRGRSRI